MPGEGVFYHIEETPKGVLLWLGGGRSVEVEFRPYFFVPRDSLDEETELKLRSKALRVEEVSGYDPWVKRKFLKVVGRDDEDLRRLSRIVPEPWEYSIPKWQRFLFDSDLRPFSKVVAGGGSPSRVGEGYIDDLTILYFSALIYSEDGFPYPGRSPVLAVGCSIEEGPIEVISSEDDSQVIGEFINVVQREDPDVIVGFGQDADELQHMKARADLHGMRLLLGRGEGETEETGRFFRGMILVEQRIPGRANVDMFSVAWRDFPWLPTKSWYELADELGVSRPRPVPKFRIAERWRSDRDGLLAYLREKVVTIRSLAEKLLPHQAELAKLTYRPLQEVTRTPVGGLVESLVTIHGKRRGWVIPPQRKEERRFLGGYVWLKSPGIYQNICYLDFKSMYPSIMILHNISPETVEPREGFCSVEEVSAEGVTKRVCSDRRGLFAEIASDLLKRRAEVKREMEALPQGAAEWKRLDAIQKAIKVVTNAMYGYMGWEGASLRNVQAAELTAALGRHYIKRVVKMLQERGLEVIYVDTDGVQLTGGSADEYSNLPDWLNERVPLIIDLQYVAERGLYLTKKKYAHLVGGRVVAKGFEFLRRDYPPIVKKAQERAVKMALQGRPLSEIEREIAEYRRLLEDGRILKEDLILIETLGKKLEDFERKTKGYVAGRWLEENKGIEVHRGQVLRVVIVKGPGSINERARPAEFFDVEDCDLSYYLRLFDQVMERTLKALKGAGVEEGRRGLEEFF